MLILLLLLLNISRFIAKIASRYCHFDKKHSYLHGNNLQNLKTGLHYVNLFKILLNVKMIEQNFKRTIMEIMRTHINVYE